jgi:hypothetical protein
MATVEGSRSRDTGVMTMLDTETVVIGYRRTCHKAATMETAIYKALLDHMIGGASETEWCRG